VREISLRNETKNGYVARKRLVKTAATTRRSEGGRFVSKSEPTAI
jgi:hypothetical protein